MTVLSSLNLRIPLGRALAFSEADANFTVLGTAIDAISSADGISYLAPYTGAVARTQANKNSDCVSVLDFVGADPTGSADSTTAFNNALASGRNVYAPAGTYKVNLNLTSNQSISGDGMRRTILIPVSGATSVILIDATSVAKQNITLSNLAIKNPNNVSNCAGIWFKGTSVANINDQHNITNIEVGPVGWEGTTYPFAIGVKATGRLISLTAINMFVSGNTIGWSSTTDAGSAAFNGNVFIQCVFQNSVQQGFLHVGVSTNVNFLGGYFQQNNSANTAGVAGVDISNTINVTFDTCGFEANGYGVAVNSTTPMSNGIGLVVRGVPCQNLIVRNCYFTQEGANIVLDSSVLTVVGGKIEGNYLNCLTNGFNFANLYQGGSNYQEVPLVLCANNYFSGKNFIYSAGIGQQVAVQQTQAIGYLTTAQALDLLKVSTIVTNPSGTLAITSVANMIPGCELLIMNVYGSASVTIAGSLMQGGSTATVTTGTIGRFKVLGSPNPGLFYRIQ